MEVSYKKLWKLLIDRDMTKTMLRKEAGITTAALAKLGKNENVNTEILVKICDVLKCDINDIIESVRKDERYNNAMQYSDKQNARDESDRAAHEAVLNSMQSGLELFREVQNNTSFRKWLFDSAFNSTYQAN